VRTPDFTGEWILNRQASTLSPGADTVQSASLVIAHREPAFRCKGSFVMPGHPFEYEYELLTDGRDVNSSGRGVEMISRLEWDGEALIVTWRTLLPGAGQTISFRYELIDAGERLRANEQVRGTDHDQDNVWMFDRR